jgi:predicted ATPase/class 3 adenylate cyclase
MTTCPNCGLDNAERVKFCAECGQKLAANGAGAGEVRRTVTVLFSDVSGSTALGERLDPESLRALMTRYFASMKQIVDYHGGTVEKFIGDAVMAVFGIPTLHEDDALRAVRAATEIRDTLAGLNEELQQSRGMAIVFRTGVNTGEVVTGDPSAGHTLVTGDTVNTAARLEQAAVPGEILLGETTYRLVRDAVMAEPSEPIEAKGKAKPVASYRLVSVTPGAAGHARHLDTPMVGRDRELALLNGVFDRSVAERAGQLVTVLGAAGIGKSRLIHEFRQQLGERASFLSGACLSYGEGITYWPLADALRAPVGVADNSVESWRAGLMRLIPGQPQAELIVEQVMGLIGVGEAGSSSDAFWAVRKLFEGMAQGRPLVFMIDDLHWATPTLLDLVEHLAGWTRWAPILLIGVGRPELMEARPGWGNGTNETTVLLEPLDAGSVDQLLAHLLASSPVPTAVPRRIAAAAEGNPLFVEELVAMLAERGELDRNREGGPLEQEPAELAVPDTIEALMAARLDQLPGDERSVLGRGSVIGKQFGAGEVAYLSDASGPAAVRAPLMAMVRRDLLRPDPDAMLPMGSADEAFSFRHQLIRDGAYAGMSKAERARLHERYARWLEELPADRLRQLDELVGYHLEQTHLLWTALGGEPGQPDTASRAASHLGAAGQRALERSDVAASANLFARAARLLPAGDPRRIAILPPLAHALTELGRFDEAQAAVDEAIEATKDGVDPSARVMALVQRAALARLKGASLPERLTDIQQALAMAKTTGDLTQRVAVQTSLARLATDAGRLGEARRVLEQAVDASEPSADQTQETEARSLLSMVMSWGTNSASDIDRILGENVTFAREHGRRKLEAQTLRAQALEAGRRGRFPEARRLFAECLGIIDDLGAAVLKAATSQERSQLEFLAGDPDARERVLREGFEQLSAMGERSLLSTVAADLADVLVDLGRIPEAEAMCEVAQETCTEDDVVTKVRLRLVRGRLAAERGSMDEALTLVASALALAEEGEYYDNRTLSQLLFARLLLDAERMDESRGQALELLELARGRGDVVLEGLAQDLIERTDRKLDY